MKTTRITIALMLCLSMFAFSCASWSNTGKGAAAGTAGGAAVGAGIGTLAGNTAKGAILGAVIGGAAGTAIGIYMDKQARELEDELENATVERVGEGIQVTFEGGILFAFDKEDLTPTAKQNIRELAETLRKYPDTNVLIEGHTDDKGADDYNQRLSERRAQAVAQYVTAQGVSSSRITTRGYGETQPLASNDSEAGRAQNRRVEVAIFANEQLKDKAQSGELR
ncbi:outer membrane protein/peptidoglycan-associated (lipo)protein [Flammeovirgaceae bacterium 311]|nr:outer membrane protein/peptidoglycan-associated (lipo)protein [Flammeovirgaceae bacterium 311]